MTKNDYIKEIIEMLKESDDKVMLIFIHHLLSKAFKQTFNS